MAYRKTKTLNPSGNLVRHYKNQKTKTRDPGRSLKSGTPYHSGVLRLEKLVLI